MNLNKPNVGRKQMKRKDVPSLDHIDPTWEEGRDYQLVCGLDQHNNWRELTYSENSAKGLRFLPWRYCKDEIGVKPVESGDLCQFLNPETEEWELMEFEGKRWWELSKRYDARHVHMMKNAKMVRSYVSSTGSAVGGRVAGAIAANRGAFDMNSPNCIKTFETLSAAGKKGGKIAGRKCADEGIGWCGADEETQREWKAAGGRASAGMLYWNNGIENKRAKKCPGEGWNRGMVK
jgi:hypothetical protein